VSGLGAQFLDEFDQSVAKILETPERWRAVRGDKRRFLMPGWALGSFARLRMTAKNKKGARKVRPYRDEGAPAQRVFPIINNP